MKCSLQTFALKTGFVASGILLWEAWGNFNRWGIVGGSRSLGDMHLWKYLASLLALCLPSSTHEVSSCVLLSLLSHDALLHHKPTACNPGRQVCNPEPKHLPFLKQLSSTWSQQQPPPHTHIPHTLHYLLNTAWCCRVTGCCQQQTE